jgi:hypothetical protein
MEMPEEATLAASRSTSSSSSASPSEPPQEFFDELLERPEHVARMWRALMKADWIVRCT